MATEDKDESIKKGQFADKPSSEKTEPSERPIPGIKAPVFVRGEWKRELTSEEIEKKQKRSEAAKRAAETRRRKRLEAEAAARAAVPAEEVAVRTVKPAQPKQEDSWQPQQMMWDEPEEKKETAQRQDTAEATALSAPAEPKKADEKEKRLPQTAPELKKAKEKILAAAAEKQVLVPPADKPEQAKKEKPAPAPENIRRTKNGKTAPAAGAAGVKKEPGYKKAAVSAEKKTSEPAEDAKEKTVQDAVPKMKKAKKVFEKPKEKTGKPDKEKNGGPSAVKAFLKKAGGACKRAGKKIGAFFCAAGRGLAALCKKAGKGIAVGWRAFLKKAKPVCSRFARWCRRGYRLIRLKLHPVMVRLGAVFYKIGFHAEYVLVLCWRRIKAEAIKTGRFLFKILTYIVQPFIAVFKGVFEMLTAPFRRLYSGFANMLRAYRAARGQGRKKALAEAVKHVGRGVRSYHHLVSNLVMWGVAAAALILFITTVYTALNQQYVLQVIVDDKSVGFVKSEEVFDKAYENVQGQIVYTQDGDEKWNIKPTYHLVRQGDIVVSNEVDVTESILRNSGEELSRATGLYIDGVFYGAVKNVTVLNQTMEALKAPYQAQYPDASIQFVQDIQLKEGVYLTKSLTDERKLSDMLSSETEGTGVYTIQKGDTLSGIAGAYGVTQNELFQLNPWLENGNVTYYPGDQVVVSMAKHFLQVKAVLTVVEEEPIAYATEATTDPDKIWTYFGVVQEGQNGAKDVTYQRTYIDGNMIEEIKLGEVVTREPVTRITVKGSKTPDNRPIVMGSGMIFPVPAKRGISRGFSGGHPAMDIFGAYGTPILAAQGGVVVKATYTQQGYGWHVAIDHGGGLYTLYAHCSSLAVGVGQSVSQGDIIAYMGSTGWSSGNHCHFEVRIGSLGGYYRGCVDPANYVGWG